MSKISDIEYKLIPSRRGNQLLVAGGYSYTKVRADYWRCSSKSRTLKCDATINLKNGRIIKLNRRHCHPPKKRKETAEGIYNIIKY